MVTMFSDIIGNRRSLMRKICRILCQTLILGDRKKSTGIRAYSKGQYNEIRKYRSFLKLWVFLIFSFFVGQAML